MASRGVRKPKRDARGGLGNLKARGAQVLSHFHELRLGFARLSLRSDEVIPFPFLYGDSFGFDTVAPAIGPVVVGSAGGRRQLLLSWLTSARCTWLAPAQNHNELPH